MAVVSLPDGQVAYTVRPDIWPLGSDILVEAGTLAGHVYIRGHH